MEDGWRTGEGRERRQDETRRRRPRYGGGEKSASESGRREELVDEVDRTRAHGLELNVARADGSGVACVVDPSTPSCHRSGVNSARVPLVRTGTRKISRGERREARTEDEDPRRKGYSIEPARTVQPSDARIIQMGNRAFSGTKPLGKNVSSGRMRFPPICRYSRLITDWSCR